MKRFLACAAAKYLVWFAAASAIAAWRPSVVKADEAPTASAEVTVSVLDESGKPLPDATVKARSDKKADTFTTDKNGEVHIPGQFATWEDHFSLFVECPNYVPLSQSWQKDKLQAVPERIMVPMQKGTKVGGVVQNEQGQPITPPKFI